MKIVLAPDSFKGSLSAAGVCEAMERGVRKVLPDVDIVRVPMADGGEGTVDALVASTGGHLEELRVTDPLGQPIEAFYGVLGDGETAVIEMAAASGLPLVPEDKRNPLFTTTFGTGELIKAG
ncbi:glycerate kinase, partial [bacterium]|nr:glycerate kinase [bacterium]